MSNLQKFGVFLWVMFVGVIVGLVSYKLTNKEIQTVKQDFDYDIIMKEGGIKEIRADLDMVKNAQSSLVSGFEDLQLWRGERVKDEIKDRTDVNRRLEALEKKAFQ